MTLQFIVRDQVMSESELMSQSRFSDQRVKPKDSPDSYFKGFRVEGFKAGQIAEAREQRQREIEAFDRLTEEDRKGKKRPKPFDLNHFLMNSRRTALRSKPYELREAADQCKAMAEKAGWEFVQIVEVKREANK